MAIPENRLSTTNLPAPFLPPRSVQPDVGESFHTGGIALNDPSLGLRVQIWRASIINANQVWIEAPNHPISLLFTDGVAISHVSLAFDANMNWAVGFVADGQPKFRWFDTVTGAFVTTALNAADSKPMLVLDDTRRIQLLLGTPDIIITYMRAGNLYHRIQRDRFAIEYTAGTFPTAENVVNFGMNTKNRLQWALQ